MFEVRLGGRFAPLLKHEKVLVDLLLIKFSWDFSIMNRNGRNMLRFVKLNRLGTIHAMKQPTGFTLQYVIYYLSVPNAGATAVWARIYRLAERQADDEPHRIDESLGRAIQRKSR